MKLMIVDDEKLLRNGFRHMTNWQSKGIEIIAEAKNGQDALAQLKNIQPDIVLTDINMPIMNGIELTQKIKTLYPQIIIVILSGYNDYEYVRESMKYGANDYLLKASVDADEIYNILKRLDITLNQDQGYITSPTQTIDSQTSNLTYDRDDVLNLLEVCDFEGLKTYILSTLQQEQPLSVPQLQDYLRDLFFFIQFHMERLNLLTHVKERKFINSSLTNLITDFTSAKEWITLVIDELAATCVSSTYDHKVQKTIDIIHTRYTEPGLSLSNIADELFINKNYLCDIFKAETHTTILQYLADVRIDAAKEAIRTSQKNLNMIAEDVGYSDYNYFSRVFKKKMGISPSSYQKLYQ